MLIILLGDLIEKSLVLTLLLLLGDRVPAVQVPYECLCDYQVGDEKPPIQELVQGPVEVLETRDFVAEKDSEQHIPYAVHERGDALAPKPNGEVAVLCDIASTSVVVGREGQQEHYPASNRERNAHVGAPYAATRDGVDEQVAAEGRQERGEDVKVAKHAMQPQR